MSTRSSGSARAPRLQRLCPVPNPPCKPARSPGGRPQWSKLWRVRTRERRLVSTARRHHENVRLVTPRAYEDDVPSVRTRTRLDSGREIAMPASTGGDRVDRLRTSEPWTAGEHDGRAARRAGRIFFD